VKKILVEEIAVYQEAVEDEGEQKYVTALGNLRKQGVTVQDLDPAVRGQMAKAIEPWVNQKAQEYEDQGFPGKDTFRRLIEVSMEKGESPFTSTRSTRRTSYQVKKKRAVPEGPPFSHW